MEEAISVIPAATIMLMCDGENGLEVLLLRRNQKAGFAPGAYVFPGGRVDAADSEIAILDRIDSLTSKEAALRLELTDGQPSGIAYYVAAVRETFEETGILIAVSTDGSAPPTTAEPRGARTPQGPYRGGD